MHAAYQRNKENVYYSGGGGKKSMDGAGLRMISKECDIFTMRRALSCDILVSHITSV